MSSSLPLLSLLISLFFFPRPDKRNTSTPVVFPDTAKSPAAIIRNYQPAENTAASSLPAPHGWHDVNRLTALRQPAQLLLGNTAGGRPVKAWFFPGCSDRRALVIGGVHGSELSSIEVAEELLRRLRAGEAPYYSVIVIPCLFPDNAVVALGRPNQIGSVLNIGRYSTTRAVDPNRQMPSPGKPFDFFAPTDHLGRTVESENQVLLRMIREFRPARITSIHAIRNTGYGGIYADPRTDAAGLALGYESDSGLALAMAQLVDEHGGNVKGNHLREKPSALYYKDPKPAAAGLWQPRNMTGSILQAHRGSGVSLGTWGSTAVSDANDPADNRDAMRVITMEFPGSRRPIDYSLPAQRASVRAQIGWFAESIRTVFLGEN